jgi:GGDEF domain-containing protein
VPTLIGVGREHDMGLPGRDELCRRFDELIERARAADPAALSHGRAEDARPAVCVVAIDEVAELLRRDPDGAHAAIDEVARRLDHVVRSGDVIGQLGEGELALATAALAPQVAGSVLERLTGAFAMPLDIDGSTLSLGVTVAVAFAGPADDAARVVARAEAEIVHRRTSR